MALDTQQLMLIEQRVTNEGPSAGVAYLLWFFLGLVSGHRFYLGRPSTAILQIMSYLFIVGVFWWIADGFLLSGMLKKKRADIRVRLTQEALLLQASAGQPVAPPPAAAVGAIPV